jgi:hypothetical protein
MLSYYFVFFCCSESIFPFCGGRDNKCWKREPIGT